MMLLAVLLIIIIASCIIILFTPDWSGFNLCSTIMCIITSISLLVFEIALIFARINAPADKVKATSTYESLYTQAEGHFYENDNDIGKKELAKEIQEWNEWLAKYEVQKNNVWINCFYPMDVSDLKPIDMNLLR